ncbi:MAG: glycerol-3-phosphate responsive antiterminator [Clostridia bacterium]|nr:glycerol-3-phosphate responsive antiterminator [Clostridia bacterium]
MRPELRSGFLTAVHQRPVIAAARSMEDVREAAGSRVAAVFLLGGSILTLPEMTETLREAGKFVFIHLDLCEGLGKDAAAVTWCARALRPDGLISTRSQLLKKAAEQGMMTIHRLFLVDSSSLNGGIRHLTANPPDLIEVLPGLVPKAITQLKDTLGLPVIAGGMVTEERDVAQALEAGALAVSSSSRALWRMGLD